MTSSGTQWLEEETEKKKNFQERVQAWEMMVKKDWKFDWREMPSEEARKLVGGINSLGLEPADPNMKFRYGDEQPKIIKVPAVAEEQPPSAKKNAKNMSLMAKKKHNKQPTRASSCSKTLLGNV